MLEFGIRAAWHHGARWDLPASGEILTQQKGHLRRAHVRVRSGVPRRSSVSTRKKPSETWENVHGIFLFYPPWRTLLNKKKMTRSSNTNILYVRILFSLQFMAKNSSLWSQKNNSGVQEHLRNIQTRVCVQICFDLSSEQARSQT